MINVKYAGCLLYCILNIFDIIWNEIQIIFSKSVSTKYWGIICQKYHKKILSQGYQHQSRNKGRKLKVFSFFKEEYIFYFAN